MGLFNRSSKPNQNPKHFQKAQGSGATKQLNNSSQDGLNKMLEEGKISAEDYAKIVENR
ncbi:hypothetical protein ACFL2V_19005 [Pseudomonadota bacterium]